jgi:hypothetical protein
METWQADVSKDVEKGGDDRMKAIQFGNIVLSVRNAPSVNSWDVVHVVVFDGEGTPLDGFNMYRHKGVWYAWTADTCSQTRIKRRDEIAIEYNRLVGVNVA